MISEYKNNPRLISEKELSQLRKNILKYGDLSGITHDLNSDEIITGNQRMKIIDFAKCEVEILNTYDPARPDKTVADGFVIWNDEKFFYRQVRFTEAECEEACITANRMGGQWDYFKLRQFDSDFLAKCGFDEYEANTDYKYDEPEVNDVLCSVGQVTFRIDKDIYQKFETKMLSLFPNETAILNEILKRLKLNEDLS